MLDEGFRPEALKTVLGHSFLQVVAGLILGVSVGLFSFLVWPGY